MVGKGDLGKAGRASRGSQIRKSVYEGGLGPMALKADRSGSWLSYPGVCILLGSQRV